MILSPPHPLPPRRRQLQTAALESVCPHSGAPVTAPRSQVAGPGLLPGVRHCVLAALITFFSLDVFTESQGGGSRLGAGKCRSRYLFRFPAGNGMLILCDCFIYFIRFPWNVYMWPRSGLAAS